MSTQVTLTIPDELYEYAQQWAVLMQQDVPETLTDALSLVLTPLSSSPELKPVSSLPDDDVLALTTTQMDSVPGERLGLLLEKQRESTLDQSELAELAALMQLYNQLWIRQSEALAEAVKRGLSEPMTS